VDEEDTIEVRPMMMLTLAADHRIVDGAVSAKFLADVVKALETPELLLF
jgi:pyruvate dehydrogenase E2 component (dihydrolipoamide acetyltransferase)